jgi:hypothetical protein
MRELNMKGGRKEGQSLLPFRARASNVDRLEWQPTVDAGEDEEHGGGEL